MVNVPLIVVANKSDLKVEEGYLSMSTETKDGVDEVLKEYPRPPQGLGRIKESRGEQGRRRNPRIVPPFNGGRPACGRPDMTKWSRTIRPGMEPMIAPSAGRLMSPKYFVPWTKTFAETTRIAGMIISPIPMIKAERSPPSVSFPIPSLMNE